MNSSPCPDRRDLQDYTAGRLPVEKWAEMDAHLATCRVCLASALTLDVNGDPLLSAIRQGSPSDPFTAEPSFREGLERAQSIGAAAPGDSDPFPPARPQQLHDYRLLDQLGRGGVGTVYRAVHTRLDRVVAVKTLSSERTRDADAVARFQREMKAVGALDHPNIVRATDAGEVDGLHFLVMEFVEGVDLSKLVQRVGALPAGAACELITQAARGLQHAHQYGLIHRDIKPANLMLAADGRVKMLDLGLARLQDQSADDGLTGTGQIMGTVDFMAPEQFIDTHHADARSDIYSLGCTFYYLLAARPPFADESSRSVFEKLKAHAEAVPQPLQTLRDDIPDEIAMIVQRMMAKAPQDRFQTATEVIEALEPFADSHLGELRQHAEETQVASGLSEAETQDPGSAETRSMTAGSSQPAGAAAADGALAEAHRRRAAGRAWSQVAVWVAVGLAVFSVLPAAIYLNTGRGQLELRVNEADIDVRIDGRTVQISSPRDELTILLPVAAGKHELEVTKDGFTAFTRSFRIFRHGKAEVTATLHPRAPAAVAESDPVEDRALAPGELRRYTGHTGPIFGLAVSEDGTRLLTAGGDATARLWDVSTGQPLRELHGHREYVRGVQFLPGADQAVTTGKDHTIRRWDLSSGKQLMQYTGHTSVVTSVSVSGDGARIASSSFDATIIVWQRDQPSPLRTLGYHAGTEIPRVTRLSDLASLEGHITWVRSVGFRSDGTQLVSAGNEALVAIWDVASGRIVQRLIGHTQPVSHAVFLADGSQVVSSSFDSTVRLWDAPSGQELKTLTGHAGPVLWLAVSPNEQFVATASADLTVRIWDLSSAEPLHTFEGHTAQVQAVGWSPDGLHVFSASDDETARMWRLPFDVNSRRQRKR